MSYEQSFLNSLFITLLIEVPIVFFLVYYLYKKREKFSIILSGIITSSLTLPYFWFIFPAYISNRSIYIIIGESAIIVIEAFLYHRLLKLKFLQALLVSLIANIASMSVGLIIN